MGKLKRPTDDELHELAFKRMHANPVGNERPRRWDTAEFVIADRVEAVAAPEDRATLSGMLIKALGDAYATEDYLLANTRSMIKLAKSDHLINPLRNAEAVSYEHFHQLADICGKLHVSTNRIKRPSPLVYIHGYPHIDVESDLSDFMIYANQQTALSHQLGLFRQAFVFSHGLQLSKGIEEFFLKLMEEVRRTQDDFDRSFYRMPQIHERYQPEDHHF